MEGKMKELYRVIADYRPNNPTKPDYYVFSDNKTEAKKKFNSWCSWLTVYEVEKLDEKSAEQIISEPDKHIIFR